MSCSQEPAMIEQETSVEKDQEKKLQEKYPTGLKGGAFLQKRMQQRKYFDSGDYNMAKAKGMKLPVNAPKQQLPPKKETLSVVVDEPDGSSSPTTGLEIPTPETVPARKVSVFQPEAGSKLSPQPHLHHIQPAVCTTDENSP